MFIVLYIARNRQKLKNYTHNKRYFVNGDIHYKISREALHYRNTKSSITFSYVLILGTHSCGKERHEQ